MDRVCQRSKLIWFLSASFVTWKQYTSQWEKQVSGPTPPLFASSLLFVLFFPHLCPKIQNAFLMVLVNLSLSLEFAYPQEHWDPVHVQCPSFFYSLLSSVFDCHSQCHLTTQDGCWRSGHFICIRATRKELKGKNRISPCKAIFHPFYFYILVRIYPNGMTKDARKVVITIVNVQLRHRGLVTG